MNTFFVIILGLVVGSFLNAVIYRLKVGVSFLKGRSYCPFCKHDLNYKDLVPVFSFLMLRGKCRYCSKKISWQYPLVELGTALVFTLLFWQFGLSSEFIVYSIYSIFLIIIFVYDWRYYLILDRVSLPAIGVALILSIFVLNISLLDLAYGILIGAGFFAVQFYVSKGKWIGGGDIRLGFLMGVMLGFPNILAALFLAYIMGSIIGIGLIVSGKKKPQSKIPFGTFLSLATLAAFIIGGVIIEYYTNLFVL